MDAELKAKWVATLRSGNYEQGKGSLRTVANECCCLGVLCDIIAPEDWHPHETGYYHGSYASTMPSPDIQRVAGLMHSQCDTLAIKNDNGNSFKAIASYIEKHL